MAPNTAAAATKGPLNAQQIKQARASLARKVTAAVKKTGHSQKNKPYSEASEEIASREAGLQVLGKFGTTVSDTARMHKRTLTPQEVEAWLGIGLISSVKFTGKVWCLPGTKPKVKVDALVESMEVKVEQDTMHIKVRTHLTDYEGI